MSDSFDAFVRRATGGKHGPYPYQRAIARYGLSDSGEPAPGATVAGLPELCRAPTGSGKTAAAVLPWLWRVVENEGTRGYTPRRLVYVLPMRSLVEQTVEEIQGWLAALGLEDQVQLHVLMGGVDRDDDAWQMHPASPAIFVGTQDMVLSRALLRGYAEPRSRWPVSFGLLHCGTQWVFDETQLLGPALGTSAQLQGLREVLGTVSSTATMWMSATLDVGELDTPDHGWGGREASEVGLGPEDLQPDALGPRVYALRRFTRLHLPDEPKEYAEELARVLAMRHQAGTQTIACLNTVERAKAVHAALVRRLPEAEVLLIHSRFRPQERRSLALRLRQDPGEAGRVVVATQVLEAGIDVSSRTLFTEAARWSSVAQRAGRNNRAGEWPDGADVLWSPPPKQSAAPYESADLKAAESALTGLEGRKLTTLELQGLQVEESRPVHALLRRRDLLQLWDTLPDLSGADVDVGPWIRDGEDTTVFVAWRAFADGKPATELFPGRRELCPAPVGEVRKLVKAGRELWCYDRLSGEWRRARHADVVPGQALVMNAAEGGYSVERGWAPDSREPVEPVGGAAAEADAIGKDGLSHGSAEWVSLTQHLVDVEEMVETILGECGDSLNDLPERLWEAAVLAGLFHDLGKAHPLFQNMLLSTLHEGDEHPGEHLQAKAQRQGGKGYEVPYFRHELASALMLLHPDCRLLDDTHEPDLIAYLVAAHHGKVRVSVRSLPGERGRVLGVTDGDRTPPVTLPGGRSVPELDLRLEVLRIGAAEGQESWTERALRLRDRQDLGPFRLAFLEALVRVADWRVSKIYREGTA